MATAFDWREDERVLTGRPARIAIYATPFARDIVVRQQNVGRRDQFVQFDLRDADAVTEAISRIARELAAEARAAAGARS